MEKRIKRGLKRRFNKRAEIGDIIGLNELIFIVLNLIFFATMFLFVHNAGSRAFIYEEGYAKQIALIVDNSKPETVILMDVEEGLEYAKKNSASLDQAFKVNSEKNRIEVKLSTSGYSYEYFSDYDVELKLNGNWLSIIIKENKNA